MADFRRRVQRLDRAVKANIDEEYVAALVANGYDEAEVRDALAEADRWQREHPGASAEEHAAHVAAKVGMSIEEVFAEAQEIRRMVDEHYAGRWSVIGRGSHA